MKHPADIPDHDPMCPCHPGSTGYVCIVCGEEALKDWRICPACGIAIWHSDELVERGTIAREAGSVDCRCERIAEDRHTAKEGQRE